MKRCPSCKKSNLTKGTTTLERTFPFRSGKVRAVVDNVPALVCHGCGEALVTGEDLGRAELIAASRLIDAGARSGALLSWTRRALGLLATDLAALLGITAETVSRWENDRVEPEPAVWNVIADLVDDRLEGRTRTQDRLRTAAVSTGSFKAPVTVRFEPALASGGDQGGANVSRLPYVSRTLGEAGGWVGKPGEPDRGFNRR